MFLSEMVQLSQSKRPKYTTGRTRRRRPSRRSPRSTGPTPAKRKGPAPIIIIAAVIVAAVFCWIFGRGCGGNEEAKENERLRVYASAVNEIINSSSQKAVEFDNLRNGIDNLTRDDVDRKLSDIETACQQYADDASKLDVPSSAAKLQPLLQLSLDMRTSGVGEFHAGIIEVLDRSNVEDGANRMSEGLLDLVVSDEALQRFCFDLEEKLKAASTGDLGYVQVAEATPFVPKVDDALLSGVTKYISAFEGEVTGDEVHGVAITGLSTQPASEDETESGISILPNSDGFTVTVAVENQGNQEEEDVQVVLTLLEESESSPQEQRKEITRIKPNETVTLVFDKLDPYIGRDKLNELTAIAGPVEGEKNVENNEQLFRFIMLSEDES